MGERRREVCGRVSTLEGTSDTASVSGIREKNLKDQK